MRFAVRVSFLGGGSRLVPYASWGEAVAAAYELPRMPGEICRMPVELDVPVDSVD